MVFNGYCVFFDFYIVSSVGFGVFRVVDEFMVVSGFFNLESL